MTTSKRFVVIYPEQFAEWKLESLTYARVTASKDNVITVVALPNKLLDKAKSSLLRRMDFLLDFTESEVMAGIAKWVRGHFAFQHDICWIHGQTIDYDAGTNCIMIMPMRGGDAMPVSPENAFECFLVCSALLGGLPIPITDSMDKTALLAIHDCSIERIIGTSPHDTATSNNIELIMATCTTTSHKPTLTGFSILWTLRRQTCGEFCSFYGWTTRQHKTRRNW